MTTTHVDWREAPYEGELEVTLPCHAAYVKAAWVSRSGRFVGRLACTAQDCRKVYEDVRLKGWKT